MPFWAMKLFFVVSITTVFTNSLGREVKGYAKVYSCHDEILSEVSLSVDQLVVVNDTATWLRCAMRCQRHDQCKMAIFAKDQKATRCLMFPLKMPAYVTSGYPTPDPNMLSAKPFSTFEDPYRQWLTNAFQFGPTSDKPEDDSLSPPASGQQGSTMPTDYVTGPPHLFTLGTAVSEGQLDWSEGVSAPDFTLSFNSSYILCKVIKFKQ